MVKKSVKKKAALSIEYLIKILLYLFGLVVAVTVIIILIPKFAGAADYIKKLLFGG
jgi:hypothetical protein